LFVFLDFDQVSCRRAFQRFGGGGFGLRTRCRSPCIKQRYGTRRRDRKNRQEYRMSQCIDLRKPAAHRAATSHRGATPADVIHEMRLDVGQLEALLGDAVLQLTTSFDHLHVAAGAQHRLLAGGSTMSSPERCEIDSLNAAVDGAIGQAVTALQFHDIASQLLAQIGSRVDALDRATESNERAISSTSSDGPDSRTTPVTQACMTAGAVQLF
jgi:hypothetical protein